MQSSPSSNSVLNNRPGYAPDDRSLLSRIAVWLTPMLRILTGGVFIFSGFVKAIDPWGSFYKFEEYVAAMGMPILSTLLLTGVFALCALEFLIGIFLLFGCYRRSTPIVALAFMCVMLPLTAWIAIADPVNDCGCFGDFLVISNWATFWKNVVLTAMIIWLVKYNRGCIAVISPAFQWMAAVVSLGFILLVSLGGYLSQPMLDFRPYPAGGALVTAENGDDAEEDFRFVYEKDGVKKEFGVDDELPSEEDGWKFVERKDIYPAEKANEGEDTDLTFRIWNREGDEDLTDDVMIQDGKMLILLIPQLREVSPATTWKINSLYDWSTRQDIEMIAVVSGTSNEIADWEDLSMPQYEIYTCDDTAIKEVARGNPAVVYLDNGKIIWKSTLSALDIDLITASDGKNTPIFVKDGKRELLNLFYLYLICMAVPVTLSLLPRIKDAYAQRSVRRQRKVTHDDKAHDEE